MKAARKAIGSGPRTSLYFQARAHAQAKGFAGAAWCFSHAPSWAKLLLGEAVKWVLSSISVLTKESQSNSRARSGALLSASSVFMVFLH